MRAMILAAGFGTRALPVTKHTPKALFPIINISQITHTAFNLYQGGVKEVGINVHHLPPQMTAGIEELNLPIKVKLFYESPSILDSAGGIRNAADWLFEFEPWALVVNCDQIFNYPIKELIRSCDPTAFLHLALIRHHEAGVNYSSFAVGGSKVTDLSKIGESKHPYLFSGLMFVKEEFLLSQVPKVKSASAREVLMYPALKQGKLSAHIAPHNVFWFDIGNLKQFWKTNQTLRAKFMDSSESPEKSYLQSLFKWTNSKPRIFDTNLIDEDLVIPQNLKITNSIVASNCSIEGGATLDHVIVFPQEKVGTGVFKNGIHAGGEFLAVEDA